MYENKIKLGNRRYFVLLVIVIIGIISISPAFAEPQIEISTKFDQDLDRMVLTLTGTDFSPNFDILFDVIHDIGIDFSIGGGQLNSTNPAGNFAVGFHLAQHAESGNYIIRVVDSVKHEFKQKLELRYFPADAFIEDYPRLISDIDTLGIANEGDGSNIVPFTTLEAVTTVKELIKVVLYRNLLI